MIENLENEIWVDWVGFEGYYQVSNLGRYKSMDRIIHSKAGKNLFYRGRLLKLRKHGAGYLLYMLSKDNIHYQGLIHIAVAKHFIPNPENKKEVNHKKGVKNDNRACELEWMSPSENQNHSYQVLKRKASFKGKFGKDNPNSHQIYCPTLGLDFESITGASKILGIPISSIWNVVNNKFNQTNGLVFRYT